MRDLPYAREAVELWHENGLTVEFLEGMSYNHRVQLMGAALRWVELMDHTPPPNTGFMRAAARNQIAVWVEQGIPPDGTTLEHAVALFQQALAEIEYLQSVVAELLNGTTQ